MIFDFLHSRSRVGPLAWFRRGSLRRSDHFSESRALSVPLRAVSWEPNLGANRYSAEPTETTLRASGVAQRAGSACVQAEVKAASPERPRPRRISHPNEIGR